MCMSSFLKSERRRATSAALHLTVWTWAGAWLCHLGTCGFGQVPQLVWALALLSLKWVCQMWSTVSDIVVCPVFDLLFPNGTSLPYSIWLYWESQQACILRLTVWVFSSESSKLEGKVLRLWSSLLQRELSEPISPQAASLQLFFWNHWPLPHSFMPPWKTITCPFIIHLIPLLVSLWALS
jgi:hypothetical protein